MRINHDFPDAQQAAADRDRIVADWWPLLESPDEDIGSGAAMAKTMIDERENA